MQGYDLLEKNLFIGLKPILDEDEDAKTFYYRPVPTYEWGGLFAVLISRKETQAQILCQFIRQQTFIVIYSRLKTDK